MEIRKVKQTSLKQQAFESIKNAIIDHSLPPGHILYERQLSEMLGISRTPVRESIPLLEMEGWVISVPRKGTFVSNISKKDVEEVIQLRLALETLVIELVLPVITNREIEMLEEIFESQTQLKHNKSDFIKTDTDFHIHLAEKSGNKRLAQLMRTLGDQLRWFGIQALYSPNRIEQTLKEHAALLEAIKNRDIEYAKQAAINHISSTYKAIINSL
ncbi:GntR family transcriptional regulator [Heyndrickxia coagulans]|uniref:GntR family transcriptional regulator n=1 Tax=Heyndrickxia coagulans TaxID=1398 RepID=UPI0023E3DE08|nr:GntR family transcriptional regulator [Heyndrickxia coagulans]